MSKKLLPVIIGVILLTAGAYFVKSKKSESPSSPQSISQAVNEAAEFGKAIESGRPTTCILTKGSDTMEYQIKGKLMRIKTSTPKEAYMINDSKYLYSWTQDSNQGSKIAIPTNSPTEASAIEEEKSNLPAPKFDGEADYQNFKDQGYSIKCQASTLSDDLFVPPSEIEFIDPSAIMKQFTMPGNGQGGIDPAELEKLKQQYSAQ